MSDKINNMLVRTATGVVFVGLIVGSTLWSFWSFAALMGAVGIGCLWEFFVIARKINTRRFWIASPFIAIFYIIGPLSCLIYLRRDDYNMTDWGNSWLVLYLFAVVWANDISAYLTGMAFGKHPMAPQISPKKTWEGFAGGLIGAIAISMVLGHYLLGGQLTVFVICGVIIALAAVAGDLFESWLKRKAGMKDSGVIFPGHGGFLDRFDAMLGVGVVVGILAVILLIFK